MPINSCPAHNFIDAHNKQNASSISGNIAFPDHLQSVENFVDPKDLRAAITVLTSLKSEGNKTIINCLLQKGPMRVKDIMHTTRIVRDECSRHLAYLRSAQIVSFEKEGKAVTYTVNRIRLNMIASICDELLNF